MARSLDATGSVATLPAVVAGALLWMASGLAWAETADERSLRGAAHDGRLGEVERLLATGTNPNVPDHNGRTAVHYAALKADGTILTMLLEAGGNPDAVDRQGYVPLHFAADFEFFEPDSQVAIRVLLDHDADPDRFNNSGQTPLHLAARRHQSSLSIFHLLDAGAGPNRPDSRGDTPLHYAVSRSSKFSGDVVAALVDRGADAGLESDDGETPLHRFARVGTNDGRIVRALVEGGTDPDARNPAGETPLHTTIRNGGNAERPDAVEALLRLGADPCIKDAAGYIPYNTAREGGPVHGMLANAGGSDIGCEGSDAVTADYVVDPADWPGELATRSNIRSGPGTDYTVVLTLDGGTRLQVTGVVRNTDWLQVEMGDASVFVHGSLVVEARASTTVVQDAVTDKPDSMMVKTWTQPVCVKEDGSVAMMTSPVHLDRALRRRHCVGIVEIHKTATCDTRAARCDWPCGDAGCWSEWTNEPKWPYSSYADEARKVAAAARGDPESVRSDGVAKLEEFHAFVRSAETQHETSQVETEKQVIANVEEDADIETENAEQEDVSDVDATTASLSAEPKCTDDTPKGSGCWRELHDQSGCHVWSDSYRGRRSVTWTGTCSGGFADGHGSLTMHRPGDGQFIQESTGRLVEGVRQGHWVDAREYSRGEGDYVDGRRHGHWIMEGESVGGVYADRFEGSYVDGLPQGHWSGFSPEALFVEGVFVDGKQSGVWTWDNRADDSYHETPYVEGKQHGQSFWRNPLGETNYQCWHHGEEVAC